MPQLTLDAAQVILAAALKTAREKELKPLAVAVYDERGSLRALAAEHGVRTGDKARFDEVVREHGIRVGTELVDVVDVPAYDTLEHLLDGVARAY